MAALAQLLVGPDGRRITRWSPGPYGRINSTTELDSVCKVTLYKQSIVHMPQECKQRASYASQRLRDSLLAHKPTTLCVAGFAARGFAARMVALGCCGFSCVLVWRVVAL